MCHLNILDSSGNVVGYVMSTDKYTGPLIYGCVPIPVSDDSPASLRIFAAISSRESPVRSESNPHKPAFKTAGALDGVQAYETHGASAGAVHWITKNGNLQFVLKELCANVPAFNDQFSTRYSFNEEAVKQLIDVSTGEQLTVEQYRSVDFCVFLYECLGAHFLVGEADDDELASVRADIAKVQCDEAWKLISQRNPLLKKHGFYDATMEDERLRLITASMSINCGTDLMGRMLSHATDKTAAALTESRIHEYSRIGATFGKTRSLWEANDCTLVTDGKPFTF